MSCLLACAAVVVGWSLPLSTMHRATNMPCASCGHFHEFTTLSCSDQVEELPQDGECAGMQLVTGEHKEDSPTSSPAGTRKGEKRLSSGSTTPCSLPFVAPHALHSVDVVTTLLVSRTQC